MANFFSWVVLGLIAGALAKLIMPGDQKGGCLLTILLGVIGAVIGGWLGQFATFLPTEDIVSGWPSIGQIVTATTGALVLLIVLRLVSRK
jgi:uncharacterized membrane protein YeaQ/YmgE (transglycosylase-associated protein family)